MWGDALGDAAAIVLNTCKDYPSSVRSTANSHVEAVH
jgi:hypothetical protein